MTRWLLLLVLLLPLGGCEKRDPATSMRALPSGTLVEEGTYLLRQGRSTTMLVLYEPASDRLLMDESLTIRPAEMASARFWVGVIRTYVAEDGHSLVPVLNGVLHRAQELGQGRLAKRAGITEAMVHPALIGDDADALLARLATGEPIPELHLLPRPGPALPEELPPDEDLSALPPSIEAIRAGPAPEVRAELEALLATDAATYRERLFAWLVLAEVAASDADRVRSLDSLLDEAGTLRQDLPVIGDKDVFDLRRSTWLSVAELRLALDPTTGATQETAILLASIADQYTLMDTLTCGEGGAGRWSTVSHATVGSPPAFDLHSLRCTVGKEKRSLFFDLSVWTAVMTSAFKGEPPPGMTTAQVEELLMEVLEELE